MLLERWSIEAPSDGMVTLTRSICTQPVEPSVDELRARVLAWEDPTDPSWDDAWRVLARDEPDQTATVRVDQAELTSLLEQVIHAILLVDPELASEHALAHEPLRTGVVIASDYFNHAQRPGPLQEGDVFWLMLREPVTANADEFLARCAEVIELGVEVTPVAWRGAVALYDRLLRATPRLGWGHGNRTDYR